MRMWCDFSCSPRQGDFVRVVDVQQDEHSHDNKTYATGVDYFIRRSYTEGMFNSCRGVRSMGSEYALSLMCGTTAEECTTDKWLTFMGTASPQLGIPITIHFRQLDEGTESEVVGGKTYVPPQTESSRCDQAPDGVSSPCSCMDCAAACVPEAPFPMLNDGGCQIATMDCMVAMSMLAFGGLCFAIMFMAVLHFVLKPNNDRYDADVDLPDYKTAAGTLSESDISTIDNLGAWLERRLEYICDQYGRVCTRHPVLVFLFGLSISIICTSGLFMVRFTTDPVELWSSPGSRARQEKDHFDTNFA